MACLFEFHGYVASSGERSPVSIRIESPELDEEDAPYFCRVRVAGLLGGEKRIFGVDPPQARQLAGQFVRDLLAGRRVFDDEGNPSDPQEWRLGEAGP